MRILVHLSDLHFGRIDEALLEPLRESVTTIAPNLVVISGDLNDLRCISDEQTKTNIEAFIEQLEEGK